MITKSFVSKLKVLVKESGGNKINIGINANIEKLIFFTGAIEEFPVRICT